MIKTTKHTSIISILAILLSLASNLTAQTIKDRIEDMMQKYVDLDQFSGTVLLAKDGEILYQKAFGDANKSYSIKNNIDTKFNIASMGKMFTGVAILQLEEKGKLKINDPVSKYLKNFPFGDEITIFHLLSHTSGLNNYMRHPDYRSQRTEIRTIDELMPIIYKQELIFDTPGKQFAYSNSGMIALGAIIENITGKLYPEYITDHILIPSKMQDTRMKFWDEVVENRATGYTKSLSGKYQNTIFKSAPPQADGGILSTVNDLLKFDQALYSSLLINDISKQKLFSTVIPKVNYGLAFQVDQRNENTIVGHGGGAPGISSYFSRYLKDKYTIIALSNYDMIARNIVYYIENIIYGKEYQLPRLRLGQFIYNHKEKIETLNSNIAISEFIKANKYGIRSPQHLNMIAYQLLNEKDTDFAITIFKLNVHLFPEEANVYDSLGEAYERNQQDDLALKNYQKAVAVATKHAHRSLSSFKATLERFKKKMNNF